MKLQHEADKPSEEHRQSHGAAAPPDLGGVRADTGVDRSLPLTAGRGRTTSGPPAAPLLRRWLDVYEAPNAQAEAALARETVMALNRGGTAQPFDDVLRLSMAIDDHVLAWGPDEPVHDNGTCSTDCAGDILARYRSERPEETALETAKRVERHEED